MKSYTSSHIHPIIPVVTFLPEVVDTQCKYTFFSSFHIKGNILWMSVPCLFRPVVWDIIPHPDIKRHLCFQQPVFVFFQPIAVINDVFLNIMNKYYSTHEWHIHTLNFQKWNWVFKGYMFVILINIVKLFPVEGEPFCTFHTNGEHLISLPT